MKLAVVGATGLVGQEILQVLEELSLPYTELLLVASPRSVGKQVQYAGKTYTIMGHDQAIEAKPTMAIFSAGGGTSKEWAPKYAAAGIRVIDNSSAWRMSPDHKLIVPEINGNTLTKDDFIIANPNCSTIQMVLVLAPLHRRYALQRIVVSTYQSVTGTGKNAVEQLEAEMRGEDEPKVYPHPIFNNALPHIDVFQDNGYTREEMKMVNETRKILSDDTIGVSATCVRLPVMGGHSEAVNVEFANEYSIEEVRTLLENTPGVVLQDDPQHNVYPMPITAHRKNEVFVGRLRRDDTMPNTLNMWIVADNLRKGAATNAVQIAQHLIDKVL